MLRAQACGRASCALSVKDPKNILHLAAYSDEYAPVYSVPNCVGVILQQQQHMRFLRIGLTHLCLPRFPSEENPRLDRGVEIATNLNYPTSILSFFHEQVA